MRVSAATQMSGIDVECHTSASSIWWWLTNFMASTQRSPAESTMRWRPVKIGSVARGDDTKEGDYDFVVRFAQGASLFDQAAQAIPRGILDDAIVP